MHILRLKLLLLITLVTASRTRPNIRYFTRDGLFYFIRFPFAECLHAINYNSCLCLFYERNHRLYFYLQRNGNRSVKHNLSLFYDLFGKNV